MQGVHGRKFRCRRLPKQLKKHDLGLSGAPALHCRQALQKVQGHLGLACGDGSQPKRMATSFNLLGRQWGRPKLGPTVRAELEQVDH